MMESNKPARRIGIMGGSFDPVHSGHLIIAQDALERLDLSEIVFIPAAIPPHKQHLQRVDSAHRLKMLTLATESDSRFSVSDIELQRGGVSYSIDTIRALQLESPDVEWVLVVGSDTLIDLHNWYKIDELLNLCEVATFLRPGEASIEEIRKKVKLSEHFTDRLMANVFESHLVEISSTEIRQRMADELRIRYLVPAKVEQYIYEHGLYRGQR